MYSEVARMEAMRRQGLYCAQAKDQWLWAISTGDQAKIASAKETWNRVKAEMEELKRPG